MKKTSKKTHLTVILSPEKRSAGPPRSKLDLNGTRNTKFETRDTTWYRVVWTRTVVVPAVDQCASSSRAMLSQTPYCANKTCCSERTSASESGLPTTRKALLEMKTCCIHSRSPQAGCSKRRAGIHFKCNRWLSTRT